MHTHHINMRTSTRTQNVVTLPASVEHQLELFSTPSAPVEPAPTQAVEPEWPVNIMMYHPDNPDLSICHGQVEDVHHYG